MFRQAPWHAEASPSTPPLVVTWGAGSRRGGTSLHTIAYVWVWSGSSTEVGGTGSSRGKRLMDI